MSWTGFILKLALVVAVTVSAALVQGRMRRRWGPRDAVRSAAARLQEFPQDFGDWHMTSARDLDAESRSQLECVGEMVRVYTNAKTGDSVSLQFILGPAGPTAAHTPEICMAQCDFTPLGERRAVAVGHDDDRFWKRRFKSKNLHGESLSVYWAWNRDGKWIAPKEDARYAFAGIAYLYKVQVACGFRGPAEGEATDGEANDGGRRFLADFVPLAAKYTVPNIID